MELKTLSDRKDMYQMSVKSNIYELTGLRGVASLLIILSHMLLIYPVLRNYAIGKTLGCFGYMGMDLFFILSGFVICYNYAEKIKLDPKKGIFEFLVARFARLYPLYILFISFFSLRNIIFYHNNTEFIAQNITSFPIFLAGMQSWFYSFIGNTPVVYMQGDANISWSISTEFALYLCFIPIVRALFKINSKRVCILSFLSLIVIQIAWLDFSYHNNFITSFFYKLYGVHTNYAPSEWLTYHSPLARIWQFLTGCVIARSYNPELQEKFFKLFNVLGWISGLVIVAFVIACPFLDASFQQYLTTPILAVFILATVHSENKVLKNKVFTFLGEVSFSTYLLHIIYVPIFHYSGQHTLSYIIRLPVFLTCTYSTAFIVYKYYEMPMRKIVKDFLLSR